VTGARAQAGEHIAVIGGGIIGGMCAWYLSRCGLQVTVIERDRFGGACSHGNCGYISPSHVLPLCQPGAIAKTLKAMLSRNSPFKVRPRLSRDWLSWFWHFARRCNERDMLDAAAGIHALLQTSLELYRELVSEAGIECEWQERGLLFVHDDPREFEAYAATDAFLRKVFGIGAKAYAGADLLDLEPALKPGSAGAWHYENDCHLRPDKLLAGLRAALAARGVVFLESTAVDGFHNGNGKATAVQAGGQRIEANHFVVATGAMTPFLGRDLGLRVPIQPGKGYSITMSKPERMPRHPLIFEDTHVAITPMESGYRIGSTMEFVGYDTSIHPRRLELLRSAAARHLHDPLGDELHEEWYGWRPMTWDGKPIIDRSPALENVWLAAGHNMLGLSMATGTGRLIADLVTGTEPHIDPAPFGVARLL
jgi:D-amino-acid dehydrogenase